MTRSYLVSLPRAEARHLAGTGPARPASPDARCVAALREWVQSITRSRRTSLPASKIVHDLGLILALAPAAAAPVRGPFGPGLAGVPPPGRVEYLGCGIVRLDETAINSLAGLPPGDDFRVTPTPRPARCSQSAPTPTSPARKDQARPEQRPRDCQPL